MIEHTQTYLTSLMGTYFYKQWTHLDIYTICNKPSKTLFGFGNTNPWQIDLLADPVQPFLSKQPDVFGYIKASASPVILISESEVDAYPSAIEVRGNYYLPIEPEEDVITTNECNTVLFKGELDHDKIKAVASPANYRSVGLYINAELNLNNEELVRELFIEQRNPFIDKNQASGDLLHLRHLDTPSYITPRLVEEVIEVVTFSTEVANG